MNLYVHVYLDGWVDRKVNGWMNLQMKGWI